MRSSHSLDRLETGFDDDRLVADDRIHGPRRGLRVKMKDELPAQQIDREVVDLAVKNVGKNHRDDEHGQQGVEQRPEHAQHAFAVTGTEVPLDQQA